MLLKSGLKQNYAAATWWEGDVCTPISSQCNVCLWGDAKSLMGICIVNANQHLQGPPEISLAYSFPSSSLSSFTQLFWLLHLCSDWKYTWQTNLKLISWYSVWLIKLISTCSWYFQSISRVSLLWLILKIQIISYDLGWSMLIYPNTSNRTL